MSNISIYFNDSVIKINDTIKYFGFTIDNKLNLGEHIATKISKSLESYANFVIFYLNQPYVTYTIQWFTFIRFTESRFGKMILTNTSKD